MGRAGIFLNRIYYGYYLIAAAFVAQFISIGTQNYVLSAFMAPMLDELGWSRFDFTVPRTIGQAVMAFVGFFVGAHVDRLGPRRFMLAGTCILGVSIYAHAFVQTVWGWWLVNGLALTTGAALLGNLVVNVTLAKWFVELRGSAVAWAAMGVSFAGVLITPGITWGIDVVGWREAWKWLALFAVSSMVPVVLIMRRAPEDHGLHPDGKSDDQVASGQAQRAADDFSRSMTRSQALRTTSFYALAFAFGLFTMGIGVMLLQTIPYVTDAGIPRVNAALMITVASIPAMLTKPVWGYFIDRMDAPRRLASLSAAITGIAIAVIVYGQSQSSLVWLYVGYTGLGMGWGGLIPLQEVIRAGYFGRRYLGSIRGVALPITMVMGASAPLLSSYYYDVVGNYNGAILVIAGLNIASAVMILLVPRPASHEPAN